MHGCRSSALSLFLSLSLSTSMSCLFYLSVSPALLVSFVSLSIHLSTCLSFPRWPCPRPISVSGSLPILIEPIPKGQILMDKLHGVPASLMHAAA